jgi:hypothetical protein
MDSAVEGWAEKIVHGGIDDDEISAAIGFRVQDAHQQDSGRAYDAAAWFEE